MNSANNITKHINLEIAKPIIRHGENVEYIRYEKNQIDLIEKIIKEYMKKANVAMTRPLHELKVLYQKDITKPLREEAKK